MINSLTEDRGYSLVEVLAAIVILAVAIIPMVGMFDAGLRAAGTSGSYDQARALANQKLEESKGLDYGTVNASFPNSTCQLDSSDTNGKDTCSSLLAPAGFPSGFAYSVEKQFLAQPSTAPSGPTENFRVSTTPTDLVRITVTVAWGTGNSYSASGLVSK